MNPIYSYFYRKQPLSIMHVLPKYGMRHFVTFLNPYSAEIAKEHLYLYKNADYICSDGILPVLINKLCRKNRTQRISFDMTSLAPIIFRKLSIDRQSIFFIGSTNDNIGAFVENVTKEYPNLNILGYHSGYFQKNEECELLKMILEMNPSTIVIGMGTPLQDKLAYDIYKIGYIGNIYTCGGFIHQTVNGISYYPKYINQFNLRWLYRIYKEKYILKRVLLYYPKFTFNYLLSLVFMSKYDTSKN